MKTEPSSFSITDLRRKKKEMWDGVRNYQARNFMRDDMKLGDKVLLYHSSCEVPGVYGLGKVASKPYPDPTAFNPNDHHYDPKSKKENPTWFLVEIAYVEEFKEPVTLEMMKVERALKNMRVIQKGQRLSVQPVEKADYEHVVLMARKKQK